MNIDNTKQYAFFGANKFLDTPEHSRDDTRLDTWLELTIQHAYPLKSGLVRLGYVHKIAYFTSAAWQLDDGIGIDWNKIKVIIEGCNNSLITPIIQLGPNETELFDAFRARDNAAFQLLDDYKRLADEFARNSICMSIYRLPLDKTSLDQLTNEWGVGDLVSKFGYTTVNCSPNEMNMKAATRAVQRAREFSDSPVVASMNTKSADYIQMDNWYRWCLEPQEFHNKRKTKTYVFPGVDTIAHQGMRVRKDAVLRERHHTNLIFLGYDALEDARESEIATA